LPNLGFVHLFLNGSIIDMFVEVKGEFTLGAKRRKAIQVWFHFKG